MPKVKCSNCGGKKHVVIDDFAITCPTCKGEGEVEKEERNGLSNMGKNDKKIL